jgi:hypothetical protein
MFTLEKTREKNKNLQHVGKMLCPTRKESFFLLSLEIRARVEKDPLSSLV